MRFAFKKSAMALFMFLVVVMTMPVLPALAIAPLHPAGCHGHLPKTPSPVSYSCCHGGHGAALLATSSSFQSLVLCSLNTLKSDFFYVTSAPTGVRYQVDPSSSPPSNFPKRI
jgi:hypothetical protein